MILMVPGAVLAWPAMPHGRHSYNPGLYVILATLINTLLYGLIAFLILRHRSNASIAKKVSVLIGFVAMSALAACHSASTTSVIPTTQPITTYPARPTTSPAPFKVFHHDASSITLVTKDNASDAEIEAILWQLRDAARAHSFDKLGVPQKLVDARDPIVFFHLYRGSKCASEKYTSGALPCGASYHAAGDFTLGGFSNHDRADGALLHDEEHQTELWNADASDSSTTHSTAKAANH